jgi:hypothetical protein
MKVILLAVAFLIGCTRSNPIIREVANQLAVTSSNTVEEFTSHIAASAAKPPTFNTIQSLLVHSTNG